MESYLQLSDRSTFSVSGADAVGFLQNLITCDVEHLSEGQLTFGALLTPQGKILFDFFILREPNTFLFDVASDQLDALMKRLTFYKLRADVVIESDPRKVCWRREVEGNDPRLSALGSRIYSNEHHADDLTAYEENRIGLGIAESRKDFPFGENYPHDVAMDLFQSGGIDCSKGCYVGQEVVSRMKHKGGIRKRPVKVSGATLPEMGSTIEADGKAVGVMGSSVNQIGIAIMRTDRVQAALKAQLPLTVGESEILVSDQKDLLV